MDQFRQQQLQLQKPAVTVATTGAIALQKAEDKQSTAVEHLTEHKQEHLDVVLGCKTPLKLLLEAKMPQIRAAAPPTQLAYLYKEKCTGLLHPVRITPLPKSHESVVCQS